MKMLFEDKKGTGVVFRDGAAGASHKKRPSPFSRHRRKSLGKYRYVRLRWRVLFAMIDFVGWPIRRMLESLRVGRAPSDPEARQPRSILLVQLDHLGDAVITTALLPLLRTRFPLASIEVLASRRNRELFTSCSEVDHVHVAGTNRFDSSWFGFWIVSTALWGLRLRPRRFDLAIDVRGEFPHAVILWLCGARRRVGWNCGGGGFLLTDSPKFVPGSPEVESRMALATLLGIEAVGRRPAPVIDPGQAARRRVADLIIKEEGRERPLLVWHVGAGTPAKEWPAEHWRELLGRVILEHDARVAFVGGRQDTQTVDRITQGLPWPGVTDWTGRLTLLETAALIERACLFVGSDSGPAHVAAAVGTPTIVLFSGTNDPRQWQPSGSQNLTERADDRFALDGPPVSVVRHEVTCSPCHRKKCPWAEHPCMRRLLPQKVLERIEGTLRRTAFNQQAETRQPVTGDGTTNGHESTQIELCVR